MSATLVLAGVFVASTVGGIAIARSCLGMTAGDSIFWGIMAGIGAAAIWIRYVEPLLFGLPI